MKIEFSKEQFLALMKTVYLGNWLANAIRTDDKYKDYEAMEDYIFSFAKEAGFDRYVNHEPKDGDRYYPTSYFEEETDVDILKDEYDDELFWEELIERLGNRDFLNKYGKEEIRKMNREERFIKRMECEEKYEDEVEKYGVERLEIVMNK